MRSKEKAQIRFYTLPPRVVEYPYLLLNRKNRKLLLKRQFTHAILDSGVMDFAKKNVQEYPEGFLREWEEEAQKLQQTFPGKLWFVIPDYPDDYNPGQIKNNVSRTLKNIQRFISIKGVDWLPVIQSRYLDKLSFLESLQKTKAIIGDYPRVAIGTVCKCRKLDFITYCCQATRQFFPKSWIHAFGLTLRALPRVAHLIDSFDSTAWTFPRERGKRSYRTRTKEAPEYFRAYLRRIDEILASLEPQAKP